MIEQQARVKSYADGRATVTMASVSGCPACDAGQGCGAGVFGRLVGRRPVSLELSSPELLQPGQPVIVGIPESLFLKLVAKLYLLPLLAGLAGAAGGHFLAVVLSLQALAQDLFALLGALILAAATLHFQKGGHESAMGANPADTNHVRLLRYPRAPAGNAVRQRCQAKAD